MNTKTSGFAAVPDGAAICTVEVRTWNPGGAVGMVDVTVMVTEPPVGVVTSAWAGCEGVAPPPVSVVTVPPPPTVSLALRVSRVHV